MSKLGALIEAERRGLPIPPRKAALLAEARKRGLVPALKPQQQFSPTRDVVTGEDPGFRPPDQFIADQFTARKGAALATGFNRGIAQTLGIPVDIVNSVLDKVFGLPTSDKPFLGSRFIEEEVIDPLTLGVQGTFKPEGVGEEVISRIGQEVGGTLPITGGMLKTIDLFRKSRRLSKLNPSTIEKVVKDLSEIPPEQLAASETFLSVLSGSGAAAAIQQFPDDPLAETAGQLIGGIGPQATKALFGFAGRKAKGLLPGRPTKSIEGRAAEILETEAARPRSIASTNKQVHRVQKDIPGFTPGTADVADDPGLISLQRSQARANPIFEGELQELEASNSKAIRDSFVRPDAVGEAGTIQDTRRVVEGTVDGLKKQLESNISQLPEIPITKDPGKLEASIDAANKFVRDNLEQVNIAFRNRAEKLFDALDPQGKVTLSGKRILGRAKSIRKRKFAKPEDFPSDLVKEIKKTFGVPDVDARQPAGLVKPPPPKPPKDPLAKFNDIRALRTRILKDLRGNYDNPGLRENLWELLESVEGTLDDLGRSTKHPGIAAKYKEARTFYREGLTKIRQGSAGQVIKKINKTTAFKTPDDEVISTFFTSGRSAKTKAKGLKDLESLRADLGVKGTEQVNSAVRTWALDNVSTFATDVTTGKVSTALISRWVKKHRKALTQFPELRQEIGNLVSARKTIEGHNIGIQRNIDDLERVTARFFTDVDPEKIVPKIMKSGKSQAEMARLVKLTKNNPRALNGLRKAVWDFFQESSQTATKDITGHPLLSPKAMNDFMETHREIFSMLYSKKDLKKLKSVGEALEISQRAGTTPRPRGGIEGGKAHAAFTANELLRKAFAHNIPIAGRTVLLGEVFVKKILGIVAELTEKEARLLVNRALIDPEIAEILILSRFTPQKALAKKLNGFLVNIGAREQGDGKEPTISQAR